MSANIKTAVSKVIHSIQDGDPVEAESILDLMLSDPLLVGDERKTIEKAMEEVSIGSPERAETMLADLISAL